jgi:hypothetical protein
MIHDSVAGDYLATGKTKRASTMMYKQIAFEFVVAVALGLVISIGAVYLIDICFGPIDEAEANYTVSGER